MGLDDRLRGLEQQFEKDEPDSREVKRRARYRLLYGYAETPERAEEQARASLRLHPVIRIQLYEEAKRTGELESIKGGDGPGCVS